jgi:hypothetical protein
MMSDLTAKTQRTQREKIIHHRGTESTEVFSVNPADQFGRAALAAKYANGAKMLWKNKHD